MTLAELRRRVGAVALAAGAVLGVLCLAVAAAAVLFDLHLLVFRSGSMSPTIGTGSIALARTTSAADLRLGDVVAVRTSGGDRVTHRIVGIQRHGARAELELRGDANRTSDATTYRVARADRVLYSVPLLGYVGGFLVSPLGLFALGLYAAVMIRIALPKRIEPRHADRPPGPAAAALALLLLVPGGLLGARTALTSAAFTDAVPVANAAYGTGSVPTPANFKCTLNLLRTQATFSWDAVAGATKYLFHFDANTYDAGTATSVALSVNGGSGAGSGSAYVEAQRNFGSTVWTSVKSPTITYDFIFNAFTRCG